MVEHLVNIGRRSAIERTAYFFLKLRERLQLVGIAQDDKFARSTNMSWLTRSA